MIEMWEDGVKSEIRRSSQKALDLLELRWEAIVALVCHKWQINFLDEDGHSCAVISFERPPYADENWYTQEVIRQLQEGLGGNNQ